MKTRALIVCLSGIAITLTNAQPYLIDQFTISGGGGLSSGGGYTLTGSIGLALPGPLKGGSYRLIVENWSVAGLLQIPEAPPLSVQRITPKTFNISWPGSEAGWRLQTAANLSMAPVIWTEIDLPYVTTEEGFSVSIPVASGSRFYRLYRPYK